MAVEFGNLHYNHTDPVADPEFPNIVEYDPELDDPESEDHGGCITETMEEVNPDGQTFPV